MQDVDREDFIALGAFDDARNVPVAFIVAEVSHLGRTHVFQEHEASLQATASASGSSAGVAEQDVQAVAGAHSDSSNMDQASMPASSGAAAAAAAKAGASTSGATSESGTGPEPGSSNLPPHRQPISIRQLHKTEGWSQGDVCVGVHYIGVDYEYRRQGIGRQLLDYVKDIAQAARWAGNKRLGSGILLIMLCSLTTP